MFGNGHANPIKNSMRKKVSLKSDKTCLSNDLRHGEVHVHGTQRPKATYIHPLYEKCIFVAKKLLIDLDISELLPIVLKAADS